MRVYNTLTRKKEELKTIEEGKVRMYVCGPTVYNYFHIGNARPFVVFDTLRKYLEYRGYKVKFVQNFTDVDDKIINRAKEEGISAQEVSEKYIKEYFKDAAALNVRKATVHPKVTETMPDIIRFVQDLIDKGYAYESNGDVYYRTRKFEGYGKLSGKNIDDLIMGASERTNAADGEKKEDPLDFALWKAAKPGEPYWESPWGKGRPGWHIECSAMVNRYLGETIDIHCGGQDLIFPHHENEIAQSECFTGKPFANYWMHNGFITVDNVKMAKSAGNFFTVRDVAQQFGYEPIRMLMLSTQYRSPINYSFDAIEQCKASLTRLYNCRDGIDFEIQNASHGEVDKELEKTLEERRNQFIEAMDDDLNTAAALAAVFDAVRDINSAVVGRNASVETCKLAASVFDELTGVLGLVYNRKKETLDSDIDAMIEARANARKEKNWAEADRIRDELKAMGIVLEDTPQGVKWHRE